MEMGVIGSCAFRMLLGQVINRGGEIISPFDIEQAVITHPRVQVCGRGGYVCFARGASVGPMLCSTVPIRIPPGEQDCLAFSTTHAVLQETVGLAIVATQGTWIGWYSPSWVGACHTRHTHTYIHTHTQTHTHTRAGRPLPDLREIQRHVSSSLHPSKWPKLLVYMDRMPQSHTYVPPPSLLLARVALAVSSHPTTNRGKPLRINLGARLGLPELNNSVTLRFVGLCRACMYGSMDFDAFLSY
jgi:acyl-CoA synthetase (AMP-forming)/AMP-acid ligase II